MRRNGFIILDDLVDSRNIRNCHFKFNYNGQEYYYKRSDLPDMVYNELVGEELAKDFGIRHAEYDLASYHGNLGVISKNFIKKDEIFCTASDLLDDMIRKEDKYPLTQFNNLKLYKKILPESVFKDVLRLFVFDVICANNDRHDENFGFVFNRKTGDMRLAPIYDNENIMSLDAIYEGRYHLGVDEKDHDRFDINYQYMRFSDDDMIVKFVEKYGKMEYIRRKLSILSKKNIDSIIERVEDKIEDEIPRVIKSDINCKLTTNKEIVSQKLRLIRRG